jgi:hypothetical protein
MIRTKAFTVQYKYFNNDEKSAKAKMAAFASTTTSPNSFNEFLSNSYISYS